MNDCAPPVQIQINGERREVILGTPLADLVATLGLSSGTALVEFNGQALLRSEWAQTRLAEGDQLEILRVVAGG